MIGAIIGDIIGSCYEFCPIKDKNFPLFRNGSTFTDDSVMTIAVGSALLKHKKYGIPLEKAVIFEMQRLGRANPFAGYGGSFINWIESDSPAPYYSYGNGSAMRVSACGWVANSLDDALALAKQTAEVTHNHPEGIKGAQATAGAIYLARTGSDKEEIAGFVCDHFYQLNRTLEEIRPTYRFFVYCQQSVPESIIAFLESKSFEDAIRNAVSLGGDADTMAAIAGSIAWAYYGNQGITDDMRLMAKKAYSFLPDEFIEILQEFESSFADNQGSLL